MYQNPRKSPSIDREGVPQGGWDDLSGRPLRMLPAMGRCIPVGDNLFTLTHSRRLDE